MDTIKVCKAAGDQIIDIFWSAGAKVSILGECDKAWVEEKDHGYIVHISLDDDDSRTICLPVSPGRIRQVTAWLAGTGHQDRNLLDVLCEKI